MCLNQILDFILGFCGDTPPFSIVLILMMCLHFLNCSPFERYKGLQFTVTCVSPSNLSFYFELFEVTYPPFSSVLILIMCLHFPNCSLFERYKGLKFRVTCVSPSNLSFYFEILKWPTPHFGRLWFSWCVYFSLIVHHL